MNPFVSWLIFIAIAGAAYYVYAKPPLPWETKWPGNQVIVTKGSAINLGEEKPDKKKKKKKEKPAKTEKTEKPAQVEKPMKEEKPKPAKAEQPKPQPATQPKIILSSDNDSEDDAQEEDPKEAIRRLHALKSGISLERTESTSSQSSKARGRKASSKQNLPAPSGTSRASSTGADADIDEKESSRYPSSSDPSDMLEAAPQPGSRILNITPSTQPPREKKAKAQSTTPEPGTQSKKNQKKKEKARQAREEELAALATAREQHRAVQKAEEVARQKRSQNTVAPQSGSAWTTVNGKAGASAAPKATSGAAVTDFLDTFNTPAPASDRSDEDPQSRSSYLDQSQWEEIPSHVREENEWATVPTKKTKERSKPKQSAASESDAPVSKSELEQKVRTRPAVTASTSALVRGKSSKGFEALSDDAGTQRSSDWDQVDSWEVHPSS
ncbi:hypothetical protein L211DRAFT_845870 [Terfezia boudieri ATCC MYA-4762]|uniref:Uncharacterized protein n=1 Tax=Terfezia boudieri ATCC MYA-4762 TaxID=1051890 RepID=A0A3N4M4N8_9PEZI|nr:hypothetical protein L211DRAFT_845870 [Terfezia boudieri ATCC MYA-4762]